MPLISGTANREYSLLQIRRRKREEAHCRNEDEGQIVKTSKKRKVDEKESTFAKRRKTDAQLQQIEKKRKREDEQITAAKRPKAERSREILAPKSPRPTNVKSETMRQRKPAAQGYRNSESLNKPEIGPVKPEASPAHLTSQFIQAPKRMTFFDHIQKNGRRALTPEARCPQIS
ncbi:MAG: hypothetical protein Q9190_000311 [Brigantiaea leucoxantha]